MESRMGKYYSSDSEVPTRSKRNEKLYHDLSGEISNFESLPIPDNSNEIDLNGLKEIISSRDEYRKNKQMENDVVEDLPVENENADKRIYDINVLLENAKNEINKTAEVNNDKKIDTNFLTDLEEEDSVPQADDAIEISEPLVNKKNSNTDSLPLDILADLKGTDDTSVSDPIVKDEVTMIKKIKEGETFYSGSFSFSKKDFEDDGDEKLFEEKSHKGIKIFFIILLILVIIAAGYFIVTKYILN